MIYNAKENNRFKYIAIESSFNRIITNIREMKYRAGGAQPKIDESTNILIEGLKGLNISYIDKEDTVIFSLPRSPIQPYIYYNNEGKGYKFLGSSLRQNSNKKKNLMKLLGEPYLKEDYEQLITILKRISLLTRGGLEKFLLSPINTGVNKYWVGKRGGGDIIQYNTKYTICNVNKPIR